MSNEQIPSYDEVNSAMENFTHPNDELKWRVFTWRNEFPERNYIRMKIIMTELYNLKYEYYDENFDVPEASLKIIQKLGNDINKEGGLDAMQACFYIMLNFMNKCNTTKLHSLSFCWDNVGDWKM